MGKRERLKYNSNQGTSATNVWVPSDSAVNSSTKLRSAPSTQTTTAADPYGELEGVQTAYAAPLAYRDGVLVPVKHMIQHGVGFRSPVPAAGAPVVRKQARKTRLVGQVQARPVEKQQQQQQARSVAKRHLVDLLIFKVKKCKSKKVCGSTCPRYHNLLDRRRSPVEFSYCASLCPNSNVVDGTKKRPCPQGDQCTYAHTSYEQLYHPFNYKTALCTTHGQGLNCRFGSQCSHAHGEVERRQRPFHKTVPYVHKQHFELIADCAQPKSFAKTGLKPNPKPVVSISKRAVPVMSPLNPAAAVTSSRFARVAPNKHLPKVFSPPLSDNPRGSPHGQHANAVGLSVVKAPVPPLHFPPPQQPQYLAAKSKEDEMERLKAMAEQRFKERLEEQDRHRLMKRLQFMRLKNNDLKLQIQRAESAEYSKQIVEKIREEKKVSSEQAEKDAIRELNKELLDIRAHKQKTFNRFKCVCREALKKKCFIPCGHTFCEACAKKFEKTGVCSCKKIIGNQVVIFWG